MSLFCRRTTTRMKISALAGAAARRLNTARKLLVPALLPAVIVLALRLPAFGQETATPKPAPAAMPEPSPGSNTEPAPMAPAVPAPSAVVVPAYGAHAELKCSECHADQEAPTAPLSSPAVSCKLCHADQVLGLGKSSHGRAMLDHFKKSGESVTLQKICLPCHGSDVHTVRMHDDPEAPAFRENVVQTCQDCHDKQPDYKPDIYLRSVHARAPEGKTGPAAACTDCHGSHSIQEPALQPFTIFKIDTECGGCHIKSQQTYTNTFHGKTTSMGFLAAAKCSDCHTAHDNLPPSDPDSTVNTAHLRETCGKCHGQVSANFIKYDPHPDPEDEQKSALLYYVNIFMKLLIFGGFGFFGVHTLLWLQRSVAAFIRRKDYATLHVDGELHVRRWSTGAVVMHIVIVSSFLGLVATGLPLRYHFTEWAKILGSIYGGVEVSRLLHRFFAVVTIGYALYHVGVLIKRIAIKKEYHLFYGPDTMVPRWKDLVDLYHNFKFFFYLGPPPRWGKWTYYEKFDYFALFWGVPIVVMTGLVMIFPAFFSRVMPGSWLNVASLVHSEEALLAAGFIFIFHFFHNHLRPGVIPMDINIFTGTMPLERLIEERPEEYERLKAEGLLDSLVVERPEARVMWESKLFGLAALSIGLFLVAAIFVSYILSH